jgi:hypothetical protein
MSGRRLQCPSAQPDWPGAEVFAVMEGTAQAPAARYLASPVPVGDPEELAVLTAPVTPTEAVRVAAPCRTARCGHFRDDRCTLVERVVDRLPVMLTIAPACAIRSECRWWAQEGVAACRRCPQVVTTRSTADPNWVAVCEPPGHPEVRAEPAHGVPTR